MKKLLRSWIESLYKATESWSEREGLDYRNSADEAKERYIELLPWRMAEVYVKTNYKIMPRYDGRAEHEPDWVKTTNWYVLHKATGILCERAYDSEREAVRSMTDYWLKYYKEWVPQNLHRITIPDRYRSW